jgi:hypothetical protein
MTTLSFAGEVQHILYHSKTKRLFSTMLIANRLLGLLYQIER